MLIVDSKIVSDYGGEARHCIKRYKKYCCNVIRNGVQELRR